MRARWNLTSPALCTALHALLALALVWTQALGLIHRTAHGLPVSNVDAAVRAADDRHHEHHHHDGPSASWIASVWDAHHTKSDCDRFDACTLADLLPLAPAGLVLFDRVQRTLAATHAAFNGARKVAARARGPPSLA